MQAACERMIEAASFSPDLAKSTSRDIIYTYKERVLCYVRECPQGCILL